MPDQDPPHSSVVLYQTADDRTRIECHFGAETIWLTQALIAELLRADDQRAPRQRLRRW